MVELAKAAAARHGLDPAIVCGIVARESSWNQWTIRYEPAFYTRYVGQLYISHEVDLTEAHARATSWGLMQVMGQVAREAGFAGRLPQLCDPPIGLEVGCQVFVRKLTEQHGDSVAALLAWNGGGNPSYAGEVLRLAQPFK